MDLPPKKGLHTSGCFLLLLLLVLSPATHLTSKAQNPSKQLDLSNTSSSATTFRLERVPVSGGAELLTILAKLEGIQAPPEERWIPMVSVLRDTLGDSTLENDRLRYLWPLTYTRPTTGQKIASAVPFLYMRVSDKSESSKVPPPVIDLSAPDHDVWDKIFWAALQRMFLDTYGAPVKASSRSYRRNASDYRKSHIVRALSVLALYQAVTGAAAFSDSELAEIQSRLLLTDKTFGGIVDDLRFRGYYDKHLRQTRDDRGHNWELVRQQAEAESLYFEPLEMPDGSTTHAMLWIAKSDLLNHRPSRYGGRFLSISNPWDDKRLLNWRGYTETRFFDQENRPVPADTEGARMEEMIPLALYGLDSPKIPMVLVDFRDALNPKKREMSRRALDDVTRNVLSFSGFGDLPYFVGRTVLDFVTGRRGIDINQPSRLRTYSQLKLLLALQESMEPELRRQIEDRLESVSLNPLESSMQAEAKLAKDQYDALLEYAKRPDGLPAKLELDRRAELVPLRHGKAERVLFQLAKVVTFGKYVHREKVDPEMWAQLDVSRQLAFHTRFLREVSKSTPPIEVAWNVADVKRSLLFVADQGNKANKNAINAAALIFEKTRDVETRRTCLDTLARIESPRARNHLVRISKRTDLEPLWKETVELHLNKQARPGPLAASDDRSDEARSDSGRAEQQ